MTRSDERRRGSIGRGVRGESRVRAPFGRVDAVTDPLPVTAAVMIRLCHNLKCGPKLRVLRNEKP
eukprot:2214357-Rhodomonas_salina.1